MKNKYTYIVIEDEPLQLANLIDMLDTRLDLDFLESFDNAEEAYDFLTSNNASKPDLMFLDMQLPEVNGLQFLEAIKRVESKPKVIITTAFEDYAIPSYEYDVSGYVVKPIEPPKLNTAIDKAIKNLEEKSVEKETKEETTPSEKTSILIKKGKQMIRLFHEEIVYLESANVNVKIITSTEEHVIRNTMKNMETMLPKKTFYAHS